jgi:hypothetical protein
MKKLIVKTLEETIEFPHNNSGPQPGQAYADFGKLIGSLNAKSRRATIITFNYDVVIEFALQNVGVAVRYCTGDSTQPENSGATKLLKLHGSLNWARCNNPKCRAIVPWHVVEYLNRWPFEIPKNGSWKIQIGSKLPSASMTHCDKLAVNDTEPVIVPPIWSKAEHHRGLANIWQEAAKELHDAESIFVLGYSLPESDSFFRYLYGLSSVSDVRIERFCVFDPDNAAQQRFRNLMGGDLQGLKFQGYPVTFGEAINRVKEILQQTARTIAR